MLITDVTGDQMVFVTLTHALRHIVRVTVQNKLVVVDDNAFWILSGDVIDEVRANKAAASCYEYVLHIDLVSFDAF